MGKRDMAASVLDRAGVPDVALWVRRRLRLPILTVFAYHRVAEPTPGSEMDPDVIDATPEAFAQQVAFLSRAYQVVNIDRLVGFLDGEPLPPNPALITFDDGYRECLDVAVPILSAHGVSATFFIATHYVTERKLFWWDRIHILVARSGRARLAMTYPEPFELRLDSSESRRASLTRLLRLVKDHHGLDLPRFLDELGRAASVPWDAAEERQLAAMTLMNWDEIRSLRSSGMDVESHTRTHRVLQTVPDEELEAELAGSRHELEAELGEPVRALAYPTGRPMNNDARLLGAVAAAGYRLGFSNVSGMSWMSAPASGRLLDVKRLGMQRGEPLASLRTRAALPGF